MAPKKKDAVVPSPSEGDGGLYFSGRTGAAAFNTGCQTLDLALGGGWAEQRVINIVGDKSTGKTLLAIEAIANFLMKYPEARVDYIEVEQAFDREYAASMGMPIDRVNFPQDIFTVEDLFNNIDATIEEVKDSDAKHPTLVIVDSLDALSDAAEMEREIDKGSMGAAKAKQLSAMFRQLNQKMAKANVTLIIISQVRDKIGVVFGRKTTRSGGRALDFYASQVVFLQHIGQEKKTHKGIERVTGVHIRAKVDKNKIGLPFREAEFLIQFGYGIQDVEASLRWMEETKNLGVLTGFNASNKAKDVMADLAKLNDSELATAITEIRAATERLWLEAEKAVAPTVKKYG